MPHYFALPVSVSVALVGLVLIGSANMTLAQNAPHKTVAKPARIDAATQAALLRVTTNRAELQTALQMVPKEQRDGMQFLIQNMPDIDLQTLSAKYLLENTALAYEARNAAPWKADISDAVFFNDILPYACLNEARDDSRKRLREIALPLISDCKTPGEAALRLNQKLFPLLKVKYSTARQRPDQAPTETMASGIATCSGLSILLVDACRAVGVPARVAGTPMWANGRGNHTWVEVWDGDWHFTGAAEPDEKGLDHGWFTHDASEATKDSREHAIYASSFRKTGISFPLVWNASLTWVPAVNVTDRYTPKAAVIADDGKTRLLVKVVDAAGKRVIARITARESGKSKILFTGNSKGETADLNDMAAFTVFRTCPPRSYEITVEYAGKTVRQVVKAGAQAQEVVTVTLSPAA